jgi:hypothetical protein
MGLSMLLPWGCSCIDCERELVDLCGSLYITRVNRVRNPQKERVDRPLTHIDDDDDLNDPLFSFYEYNNAFRF